MASTPAVAPHSTATALPAVDPIQAEVQAFLRRVAQTRTGPETRALVSASGAVIARAVAADHYQAALNIAAEVYRVCSATGGKDDRKAAAERRAQLQQAYDRWQQYRAAQAVLNKAPNDGDAQLTVGHWLCIVKGEWAAGLVHLAKGSRTELRQLAERELRLPDDANEQLGLADAWWDLGLASQGDERRALLLRAGHWYRQAEPEASAGLAKIKIQKRLEDLTRLAPDAGRP